MKSTRFIRGLIGTSLTWGVVWSALNTVVLFARYLPEPPNGATRAQMAVSILSIQSKSALISGCVYGALFALLFAFVARRWPAVDQLRFARLTLVGVVVGFGLPSVVEGFGSFLNIAGIALSASAGAGIGAAFARLARETPQPTISIALGSARLPSA